MESTSPTYTITELAREFDITPRAIRFYEDHGLLAPQRVGPHGQQRLYSTSQRTRLKLTLRGKRLGFSLSEIKDILDLYTSPRDTYAQLIAFQKSLAAHRQILEQRLEDIQTQLKEITQHEMQCLQLLEKYGTQPSLNSASKTHPHITPTSARSPTAHVTKVIRTSRKSSRDDHD